ncbi:DUF3127 domain-containing protein [Flexithrix dorotheae]|uniref:DUF3127 domain-containing protein n=1 Tax=Flexithrix dorotheae TaxID=70993 RepID=UPI00037B7387|nr:DUF3127 domain-containing protein [Flexithrix dorotheae]
MALEVKGKLVEIYNEAQITERFKKREFVIEIQDGMYSEYVKMQLTQDKCGLLDQFSKGDEIKVNFNLKGRPYTKEGKTTYFTNLDAWRIESASEAAPGPGPDNFAGDPGPSEEPGGISEASEDELPF